MVGVTQVWTEPITPLISVSNPLRDELVMPHGNCSVSCKCVDRWALDLRALPEERGGPGTAQLYPYSP